MPQRLQLRPRFRLPDNAVAVTPPHRWANPYKIDGPDSLTPHQAARLYRAWLALHPELVWRARRELAGHDLACFCSPLAECHADVLLEAANSTEAWPPQPVADEVTRFCPGCCLVKPITRFYKNKQCTGGHLHRCKPCWNSRYRRTRRERRAA